MSGGFRVYTADVLDRVRFIRQVQRLLTRKLADVDARLVELQEFRRSLRG